MNAVEQKQSSLSPSEMRGKIVQLEAAMLAMPERQIQLSTPHKNAFFDWRSSRIITFTPNFCFHFSSLASTYSMLLSGKFKINRPTAI